MCERTIAEYKEELCPTKEEKERQRQLLEAVCNTLQVVLHRIDVNKFKEEDEEVWVTQEEADLPKFSPTVKTEDLEDKAPESSHLHHSPKHLLPEQQGKEEPHTSHFKEEEEEHHEWLEEFSVVVKSDDDDEVKVESEEKREAEPPTEGGGAPPADKILAPLSDLISKIRNFSRLNRQSKQEVINAGRPTPELPDLIQTRVVRGQKLMRSFQKDWYTRKEWLCGCPTKKRLYCYPCLLFSKSDCVWTQMGYTDLKNLPRNLEKHESSAAHIQGQISFKTCGMSRVDLALNEQRRLNISIHNANVKENREILKDLIDATCYLGKQGLAFGGTSSSDGGNYVQLLHLYAEKDERLARHLETSLVFTGTLYGIQDDLVEAVGDVLRNDIKQEIDAARFVAVKVDQTTDDPNQARISLVLRYVATKGGVKEAFLGFDDVSGGGRAAAVARSVFGLLEKYDCVAKLVAQTYDGALMTASELDEVQVRIKDRIPEAMFTHCHTHHLNMVLSHCAKCIPECTVFFRTVEGMTSFFNKSRRLTAEVVKRRLPARWSSNARLMQSLGMYQSDLRQVLRTISEDPDNWDNDTQMMAVGYDAWLSRTSTWFLIMTYQDIVRHTNSLFRTLKRQTAEEGLCRAQIRDTMAAIERSGREFDTFYDKFERRCEALGLTDDGRRQSSLSVKDERKRTFDKILQNVREQLKARFDQFGDLAFLGLVDCARFQEMSRHFDNGKLQSLSSNYGNFFDLVRLKSDLLGLYGSQQVRSECKSPDQLFHFLVQKDLLGTVPEATKLLQLALTLPVTAASAEWSFSTLQRIKTYSRTRTDPGRLSSLAIIFVERERLLKLKEKEKKEDFYNQVIEIFVQKERRMDFIYT
ncbi:uncharacterized protein LOC133641128 [Entelurus aequoreus]|uniref:uncharacterized protein LOC133641128 n=1 Tax=Entelurus aequoreus TaxID=161455 RepID=UPI002B1E7625|nr:uncharacterized protein LOC133641128 [Entelurus aequoreus]XP_061890994.1 uncharacterized protein LOC133641128 [Entelurus aequoreus]